MTAHEKIETLLGMVDFPEAEKDKVRENLDKLDLDLVIIRLRKMAGVDGDERFTTAYHA